MIHHPTLGEFAERLDRVREAYRGGYYDEFDDHESWHPGTRHLCHLVAVSRVGPPVGRAATVLPFPITVLPEPVGDGPEEVTC